MPRPGFEPRQRWETACSHWPSLRPHGRQSRPVLLCQIVCTLQKYWWDGEDDIGINGDPLSGSEGKSSAGMNWSVVFSGVKDRAVSNVFTMDRRFHLWSVSLLTQSSTISHWLQRPLSRSSERREISGRDIPRSLIRGYSLSRLHPWRDFGAVSYFIW